MVKPFPLSLNIGTDICSIARVLNFLTQPAAQRFVSRILTLEERTHYQDRIELPLGKWQDMIKFQTRLTDRRDALGLSSSELAHCFQLRKGGRMGVPTDWLREFRQRRAIVGKMRRVDKAALGMNSRSQELDIIERKAKQDLKAASVEEHKLSPTNMYKPIEDMNPDDLDALLDLRRELDVDHKQAIADMRKLSAFMAGRFAAKEAVMKAHHNQRLTYHRISILPEPGEWTMAGSRPPICVVIPEGGQLEDGQQVKISISHDIGYATAVCLSAGSENEPTPTPQDDEKELLEDTLAFAGMSGWQDYPKPIKPSIWNKLWTPR